jgi:hypothetical protein
MGMIRKGNSAYYERIEAMTVSLTQYPTNTTNDIAAFDVDTMSCMANAIRGMKWDALNKFTGGLSAPSKMPCYAYSISAHRCNVGRKLRLVVGSTCADCYALKGRYEFPNVKEAMERRYAAMMTDAMAWAAAMVASINKTKLPYFRWHDSGDIQGMNHLAAINAIAHLTPTVQHWIPTREYGLIRQWQRSGFTFARNLTVRVSLPMVGKLDGSAEWSNYSTVDAIPTDRTSVVCPSSQQGNQCVDCRSCWDKDIECVSYVKH